MVIGVVHGLDLCMLVRTSRLCTYLVWERCMSLEERSLNLDAQKEVEIPEILESKLALEMSNARGDQLRVAPGDDDMVNIDQHNRNVAMLV